MTASSALQLPAFPGRNTTKLSASTAQRRNRKPKRALGVCLQCLGVHEKKTTIITRVTDERLDQNSNPPWSHSATPAQQAGELRVPEEAD